MGRPDQLGLFGLVSVTCTWKPAKLHDKIHLEGRASFAMLVCTRVVMWIGQIELRQGINFESLASTDEVDS